ncbi:MAG TPA: vanadium-dependent haloperoxidase, partial [Planctomycetota bacterium]|nr:vanadium-dependent haloperoxidase [Planctomycetota bacterium]
WGTLRTFALADADGCPAAAHPTFSTDSGSEFYAHALIVFNKTGDAGANLSQEEFDIAMYWADFGGTGTPPGHWVAIAGIVAAQEAVSLDRAAEAYARVGMAVADGFIACWRTKFTTYLQRPITYIQANIPGGADWDPIINTPNFPTYTSGHSTQSGAAAAVLTDLFGPVAFTDTTHTDLNPELMLGERMFANFAQAASEAAVSRLYGGIHYVFDNELGVDQGNCIGAIINSRVKFDD